MIESFDDFLAYIAQKLEWTPQERLQPAARLADDVGCDSLQIFEIVDAIESVARGGDRLIDCPRLVTLGDAYQYYRQVTGVAGS